MNVLVINCGSSSVKWRLLAMEEERLLAQGGVDRIGVPGGEAGEFWIQWGAEQRREEPARTADHPSALERVLAALTEAAEFGAPGALPIDAVGHRVVHGGERFSEPVRITPEVVAALEACSTLAPLHNPANLQGIRAAQRLLPHVPHVAVFDTAFHATLPERAFTYAIPRSLYREHGARRYGFHGTSHQYISERARALMGEGASRLVSLHLGNGCSAAAIREGRSVDTSMGFTPTEGLVMGTRSGDVDPGLVLFLAQSVPGGADEVERLLNHAGGLLGLSETSGDMRDIEARRAAGDRGAALAFDVFCYRARRYIGAYAAAMGGLDAVVFTAGIGENSARVREEVCGGLEFLGLRLDPGRNGENREGERKISAEDAAVSVWVIPTNEELMIARAAAVIRSHAPAESHDTRPI